MNKRNRYAFFIIGLLTFYFAQIISPNKFFYFSSYFVTAYIFYLSFKDIFSSLTLILVLSLFSEISVGAGLFVMQPYSYNLGSGYWITSTTIISSILLVLSLGKKIKEVHLVDVILLALYCWVVLSTLINLDQRSLFGLIQFSQTAIVYILFRIHLTKALIKPLSILLVSMLIFECTVAILQVYQGKPLGLLAESANTLHPQGYFTTEEEIGFFRVTGTLGHPNITASVLLALSPFVYASVLNLRTPAIAIIILYATYMAIFFTYSRVATVLFTLMHILLAGRSYIVSWILSRRERYIRIILIMLVLALLAATIPSTVTRILSLPRSFEETGSLGFRVKLAREAVETIKRFPLIGVGLESSLPHIIEEPVTDVFSSVPPSNFYKIHSLLFELGSEAGIPALLLFIAAIITVLKHASGNSMGNLPILSKSALIGVMIISSLNPFLHTSQVTLIGFLIAFILVQ